MAWSVEFDPAAAKDLSRMDRAVAVRVLGFMKKVAQGDPRAYGFALQGPKFGELWRYRVGDLRILCRIEDRRVCVVVVHVGDRREVYR